MWTDILSGISKPLAGSAPHCWPVLRALAICGAMFSSLGWAQGTTTRVSVGAGEAQANDSSMCAALSADGRYVAFASSASNLVSDDTNGVADIFVRDRATGTTTRVSVSSQGVQGNGDSSFCPAISADGRYVAFASLASNLVSGDTNGFMDVFGHDIVTGETTLASAGPGGVLADAVSSRPAISADGRFVAFESHATNLVADDTNNALDVFVRDRVAGTTMRVSLSSEGVQGNSSSFSASLSADGHLVAFASMASNLSAGDTNADCPVQCVDVFVHDLLTGQTTREGAGAFPALSTDGRFLAFRSAIGGWPMYANVYLRDRGAGTTTLVSAKTSVGTLKDGDSYGPAISGDGRFVAFASDSSLLITGDTNNCTDVFVYDKTTSTISRVSVGAGGEQSNGGIYSSFDTPAISADGRYVAFESNGSTLVPNDTNYVSDVFVHDRNGDPVEIYLAVALQPSGGGTIAGTGISCPGDCLETFTSSPTVTLTATPAAGYAFDRWAGCDSVASNQCTVTMNGTKHLTATFTETSPVLTASIYPGDTGDYTACTSAATCGGTLTAAGINCPGDCSEAFSPSETVILTAAPKPGYIFKQWPLCDVPVANQCTVTMTRSRMVVAEFATGLTVSVNPATGGTVTGYGISCPGDCSEYYSPSVGNYSSSAYTATLTQAAKPGYIFSGWTGCTTVSGNECSVQMSSPKNVVATYTPSQQPVLTVNISPTGGGTVTGMGINCPGDCSETVAPSQTVFLLATPGAGYTFSGWTGCTSALGLQCNVTLTASATVTATFTATRVLTIFLQPVDAGMVAGTGIACPPDCSEAFASTQTVTLTAYQNTRYSFSRWVGCTAAATRNQCTVTVDSSRSVTAVFTAKRKLSSPYRSQARQRTALERMVK